MDRDVDDADVDDAYLVRRAQQGYLDAYTGLVSRHSALAYRVALRLLGVHEDAQDVAQEALVTPWEQLPDFRAGSAFSTWLYRIVTRKALNRMTRTKRTDPLDLLGDVADSDIDEPARHVERRHAIDAVTDAVTALPPAQRIAIVFVAPLRGLEQRRRRPHHRQHGSSCYRPPVSGQAHTECEIGGVEVNRQ